MRSRNRLCVLCGLACAAFPPTFLSLEAHAEKLAPPSHAVDPARALGVCPPHKLRDEAGREIDPVRGVNAAEPYSPKQTCGASGCHDYAKITQGYHFTQGKGEAVPERLAARYPWVRFPGN